MRAIWIALLGVALLAGSASGASKGGSISLVAYSTPKDAYGKIISGFQKTQAGSGVDFNQSYGASGDQARAVAAGQDADLVALSLDPRNRAGQSAILVTGPDGTSALTLSNGDDVVEMRVDNEIGPSVQYKPLPAMHIDFAPLFGIGPESREMDIFLVIGWEF